MSKHRSSKTSKVKPRGDNTSKQSTSIELREIFPLTSNQEIVFDAFEKEKNLLLTGTAGTGKSFLALYLAMSEIERSSEPKQLVIVRSLVSSRDIGFLPGSEKEKALVYEAPYYSLFAELYNRGDAYEILKQKNIVKFMSTSYVRGITINNAIIVVDEFQNCDSGELASVMTRIGKNCRVILCGDLKQNDLNRQREASGFTDFFMVISKMKSFSSIEFGPKDILRSDLVREYILVREELESQGKIKTL